MVVMKKLFIVSLILVFFMIGCTDSETSYNEKKQKEVQKIEKEAGNR